MNAVPNTIEDEIEDCWLRLQRAVEMRKEAAALEHELGQRYSALIRERNASRTPTEIAQLEQVRGLRL